MGESSERELHRLREDLKQVRDDLSKLMQALLKDAQTEPPAAGTSPLDPVRSLLRQAVSAKRASTDAVDDLEDRVRKHPLVSVLAAVGVGYILGKLASWR